MKIMNRIMGIISIVLGALCIAPSIIGIFIGISSMTEDEIIARIFATIVFELCIFAGGAILTAIPEKPIATIISSIMIIIAGVLQIIYIAEFNLVFNESVSLLVLSWVAFISIVFGLIILVFSIKRIIELKKAKDMVVIQEIESRNNYNVGSYVRQNVERCINCNANMPENAKFCPICGHELVLSNRIKESERKSIFKKKIKIVPTILVLAAVVIISVFGIFVGSMISSDNSIYPTNANEDELKLISYIIENGIYIEEDKEYLVRETINEAGMDFHYSILYNMETKKLTFQDTSSISSGITITTMNYEYGAEKQSVSINMAISGGNFVSSKGVIYPATYTNSNKMIHSFESSYSYDKIESICELSVYQMLTHCQLIMIDADTGMVPFGFEKGLFK